MCRWIVFAGNVPHRLGDVLSKPTHSLVSQSFSAAYHPGFTGRNNATLNADGFGCVWFSPDGRCFVFKTASPAWSDPNLAELVEFIESPCIFGHVRAASPGSVVSHENCHPFKSGRLAMMHNGHIEGFGKLRRALLGRLTDHAFGGIRGLTDSEHAFALLLSVLKDPARAAPFPPGELATAVVATIASILTLLSAAGVEGGFTSLNFALTDGETVVATRYCDRWPEVPPPSLYFSFPLEEELAAEITGKPAEGAKPGDGSANGAAAPLKGLDTSLAPSPAQHPNPAVGGGSVADAAAALALKATDCTQGDCFARRAARIARDDAFLAAAAPTAGVRALLVASEPATEGGKCVWLAMPANSILVFTRGKGATPPVVTKLEDLLPQQMSVR